jgi:hypothetical protein
MSVRGCEWQARVALAAPSSDELFGCKMRQASSETSNSQTRCVNLRAVLPGPGFRGRSCRRRPELLRYDVGGMKSRRFALPALAGILVAALGASGCRDGSTNAPVPTTRSPSSWSAAVCEQVARGAAREGEQALLHYRPPLSNYPPDVALLGVRIAVGGLERHHCSPAIVGRALARRLTRRQRAELFSHLPPHVVHYLSATLGQT